jgi:murein DD-endopeptidase MepM/ murein hydrolase activator NlpD
MRRLPDPCRQWTLLGVLVLLTACAPAAPLDETAPAGRDIVLAAARTTVVRGVVPRNATLDSLLRAHGLAEGAVAGVIDAARGVFDLRRLRSAQPFLLERTADGLLRLFQYEVDATSYLRVVPDESGPDVLKGELAPIPRTLEHDVAAGAIDSETPSLFQAMQASGESPDLAMALAEIFSGEIDFNRELQPGDRFALTFERYTREDGAGPAAYGAITSAEFHNAGRVLRAVRFAPPGGPAGYYDAEGRSLKRFFLKSPLKFEPRVTSRFSTTRMHPVLHTARAHRGVDYAAPHGASVVSVASGTVVSATVDGVNGRMVRLRHAGGYDSYYLHLSAFAPGIRSGARVEQGQLVGRVGATGLATGPHLHYGLRRNDAWIDPLREHARMPPGDPVPAPAMSAFQAQRDAALGALASALFVPDSSTIVTASH